MDEAVLRGPHIIQHWKTFPVFLEKTTGKDPGFVFHEKLYNSSEVRHCNHVFMFLAE